MLLTIYFVLLSLFCFVYLDFQSRSLNVYLTRGLRSRARNHPPVLRSLHRPLYLVRRILCRLLWLASSDFVRQRLWVGKVGRRYPLLNVDFR